MKGVEGGFFEKSGPLDVFAPADISVVHFSKLTPQRFQAVFEGLKVLRANVFHFEDILSVLLFDILDLVQDALVALLLKFLFLGELLLNELVLRVAKVIDLGVDGVLLLVNHRVQKVLQVVNLLL